MSVAEATYQPLFAAEVLSAPRFLPPVQQNQGLSLAIHAPAFGAHLEAEIIDMDIGYGYSEVTFESFVDAGVAALLTLRNERSNGVNSELQIKGASLSFQVRDHRPRAHFIADSLYAMLGLAGPVKVSIPAANVDLDLHFDRAPSEVSKFLELRQIYFGLMAIEKATGSEFEIPEYLSGEERNAIAFAYNAITRRDFVWRVNDITTPMPATDETLTWFDNLESVDADGRVYKLMFGPTQTTRSILGREISLGDQTVFINDGIIEEREVVRRELTQNDGHIVPIRVIPRSRKGRYVFANTPHLPETPWDEKVENFVSLEKALDERLAASYNDLAASTVADLTPEEIKAVTARPELDEDAYLIRD